MNSMGIVPTSANRSLDPHLGVCVGQTIRLDEGKLVFCPSNCAGKCKAGGKEKVCHYVGDDKLAKNVHYCRETMIVRSGNMVSCPRFVSGKCQGQSCLHKEHNFIVTNPAG